MYKLNLWAEESLEYVANSVEAEGLKLKETKAGVKVYFDIISVPVHPIKAYFKAIPYSQKHWNSWMLNMEGDQNQMGLFMTIDDWYYDSTRA